MEKDINEKFDAVLRYFNSGIDDDYKNIDVNSYSSLTLALIGDAIYDLFIRYFIISEGDDKVNILHRKKSYFVKAETQADFIDYFCGQLSEKEHDVYRRGRNKKSNTSAKNASIISYRKSTGFEALIGYLFLSKSYDRMIEIIKESIKFQRGIK